MPQFFLTKYEPAAVLAPWNGGSGFYPKDNRKAIDAISAGAALRFQPYRETLTAAREVIARLGLSEKPDGPAKEKLLFLARNRFPDAALGWLDAVFVLGLGGAKYPPLLGTGGNDGRLEFTNNFMQRLTELFDPATGEPAPAAARWLDQSLFASTGPGATASAPIGQFFPGAAGGANATSGFDGGGGVNPWDFVLMIEGALLFAAATVKKLESEEVGQLVYPFCVRQAGVGYGSASASDEKDARCEMWMPLWERPCSLAELRAVFSEGRAQVQGRPARNGVDFARAAVTLGVDRGLSAFQRYGFQVRNGLSYFATPLDRIAVRRNAKADLLADADAWLDRLRSKAGPQANPTAPASVARALNRVEARILELCQDGSRDRVQAVLAALGAAERALARSFKWTTSQSVSLRPLAGLRRAWIDAAASDLPEFRLALALAATVGPYRGEAVCLRQHLEPVKVHGKGERFRTAWLERPGNDVVWHDGDLTDTFNAILARRLLRAQGAGDSAIWTPPSKPPPPARAGSRPRCVSARRRGWPASCARREPAYRFVISPAVMPRLLRAQGAGFKHRSGRTEKRPPPARAGSRHERLPRLIPTSRPARRPRGVHRRAHRRHPARRVALGRVADRLAAW